uniref:Myelin protein P0 C-terminal domain-containing protein n=1 Tax=Mus spicilegus TaxID=10103 RepID=A0A8C6MXJ5_MUSSI
MEKKKTLQTTIFYLILSSFYITYTPVLFALLDHSGSTKTVSKTKSNGIGESHQNKN